MFFFWKKFLTFFKKLKTFFTWGSKKEEERYSMFAFVHYFCKTFLFIIVSSNGFTSSQQKKFNHVSTTLNITHTESSMQTFFCFEPQFCFFFTQKTNFLTLFLRKAKSSTEKLPLKRSYISTRARTHMCIKRRAALSRKWPT